LAGCLLQSIDFFIKEKEKQKITLEMLFKLMGSNNIVEELSGKTFL
jgi:hypothetical protein